MHNHGFLNIHIFYGGHSCCSIRISEWFMVKEQEGSERHKHLHVLGSCLWTDTAASKKAFLTAVKVALCVLNTTEWKFQVKTVTDREGLLQ